MYIKTDKPKNLMKIEKGVYGTSTNTYNQAGQSYNQASQVYGGADNLVDVGPNLYSLTSRTPFQEVIPADSSPFLAGRFTGVYGTSLTTYNQAGNSYNQATQTYGGADIVTQIGPHLLRITDLSTIPGTVTPGGNAGIPMGLLLALTYT